MIDPDSAVKALEDIATAMQEATPEERTAFIAACAEEAARLEKDAGPGYANTAKFIRGLPESLGLDDEEA